MPLPRPAASTLPRWATSATAPTDLEEPSAGRKDTGWQATTPPAHGLFNWLGRRTYDSLAWVWDVLDEETSAGRLKTLRDLVVPLLAIQAPPGTGTGRRLAVSIPLGTGSFARMYATEGGGWELTLNAAWLPGTGNWQPDVAANSMRLTLAASGLTLHQRANASAAAFSEAQFTAGEVRLGFSGTLALLNSASLNLGTFNQTAAVAIGRAGATVDINASVLQMLSSAGLAYLDATAGTVNLGTLSAEGVNLGRSGKPTTVRAGALSAQGTSSAELTATAGPTTVGTNTGSTSASMGRAGAPTSLAASVLNMVASAGNAVLDAVGKVQLGMGSGSTGVELSRSGQGVTVYGPMGAMEGATLGGGSTALRLMPGTLDHVVIGLYARTAAPGTLSGYLGYATGGSAHLDVANSLAGGKVRITPGSGGVVEIPQVSLTGGNPATPAAGFTNVIMPKNAAKAWCSVQTNGTGGVSITNDFNIKSASLSSGLLTLVFGAPMTAAPYAVVYGVDTSNNTIFMPGTQAKSTTQFVVKAFQPASMGGGYTDVGTSLSGAAFRFDVVVYGEQ